MSDNAGPAAVALGIVATGVGIVAVNHMISKPGESWYDRIKHKLTSRGDEEAPALPERTTPEAHEDRRAAPPARRVPQPPPTLGPRRPTQVPSMTAQIPRRPILPRGGPVAPPLTVTPEMVREAARQINAVFGTSLRADGIISPEMQQIVKQVQQQAGLPATGYPDARLISALGTLFARAGRAHPGGQTKPAAKPTVIADAANMISKTFGGPASTASTGPDEGVKKAQQLLNAYFKGHILDEDGIMGPKTIGAITEFQQALGLPTTGKMDDKTHDMLVRLTSESGSLLHDIGSWFGHAGDHATGAGSPGWATETIKLGQAAQAVIDRAISENDPRTLTGLSRALKAAGFPQAAAATAPKSGATATTGGPGYFPDPFFGWYGSWADPYTFGPW
jgi:peptidoglycan hydrolase-like protein with peptidoglycan-binding domain